MALPLSQNSTLRALQIRRPLDIGIFSAALSPTQSLQRFVASWRSLINLSCSPSFLTQRSKSHCVLVNAFLSLLLSAAKESPSCAFIIFKYSPGVVMCFALRSCHSCFSRSQSSFLHSWLAFWSEVFSLLLSMNFWYHCRRSCSALCWSS